LFVEDGDQTVFAGLLEVVAGDEELLLLLVHGKGGGPEAARELVEDAGVENSGRVDDDSEDTVLERFSNVKNALIGVHGEAGGMSEASVDDGLEHGDVEVDHEKTALRVLERALTKGSRIGEEKGVSLFREEHGVGSLKCTSIKILDNGNNLDSVVSNSLRQDSLMTQISNERGTLAVEHKAGGLTSSREGSLHLSLLSHLVDITVGGDGEEVTIGVLGW